MNKLVVLENGIRLSIMNIPHVHTVSIGCFFGAGSRYENKKNNGISHFIEHMVFKGTTNRSAFDLVCAADDLGANLNAYTGKEATVFYIQCLYEHREICMDILSDLLLNHTFPEDELEKEKEVVVEEIKMCEDTPDDLCHELAGKVFWGDSTLSYPILGTEETVRSFTREDLIKYEEERYVGSNLVISVAGGIDEAEAIRLVNNYFGGMKKGSVHDIDDAIGKLEWRLSEAIKPNEQANICISFGGVSKNDPDRDVMIVLCSCFGGNMSSVLFHRLREEMSLAYSVYSYPTRFSDRGAVSIYIGTSPAKVKTALIEIKKIIDEYIEHGFSESEFKRGINQLKSGYLMGMETSMSLMRLYGEYALAEGKEFDIDKQLEEIDKITLDDINRVFRKSFTTPVTIGYVGSKQDFDMLSIFKGE